MTEPMTYEVILVCGGRDYEDIVRLEFAMDAWLRKHPELQVLIHGGARGADKLAGGWAKKRGIHVAVVEAQWETKGRHAAGPLRNEAMLWLRPDAVIAFPGGNGTADMVRRAEAEQIPVWRPR